MGNFHFEFNKFEIFLNFPLKNFDDGGSEKSPNENFAWLSLQVIHRYPEDSTLLATFVI